MKFSDAGYSAGVVGRFAPSPTGPLHFGSLLAAMASYLEARQGQWLVRIEDVDRPRALGGMADDQLQTLQAYGFKWSSAQVVYQSARGVRYETVLHRLIAAGLAYPCTCSRSSLAQAAHVSVGVDGARIYPGTCATWQQGDPVPAHAAWRFRVGSPVDAPIVFEDRIQGLQQQQLAAGVGDFVIQRADGCYTYQLAAVVDDLAQGVNQVVRGADLLDSTARQIALIRALGGVMPVYAHIPVAVNLSGEKLSKQTRARRLPVADEAARVTVLWAALHFLGQMPPDALRSGSQAGLWHWASESWSLDRVPRRRGILSEPTLAGA